ncbi:hypothetical protein ZWY2020_051146 [Hordeum vulgare]|nr:hypothetical protein ZWY2020_051146 [Hordeum vulgare]
MVARMMRWPRPPQARKFRVRLVVRRAEGLPPPPPPSVEPAEQEPAGQRVAAEVRWKGPRASGLGSLRRAVRRNRTRGEELAASGGGGGGGAVAWEEGFESVVTLAAASHREAAAFQPWELAFTVFTDVNKGPKTKPTILGTASLSLADYASAAEEDIEIILPLSVPCGAPESVPSLHLTLSMVELRAHQETSDASQRSAVATPLSPSSCDSVPGGKDEVSVIKAGLRKVKTLRHIVSARRSKKTFQSDEGSEDNCYIHSDGSEYPYGTEHVGEDLDDRTHEDEVADPAIRKSFSYGSLQSANYVSGLVYAHAKFGGEHEDWVYYSHRKSDAGYHVEQPQSSTAEGTVLPAAKRSILPWRKRKLGLRSLKAKGEPLLKKANGEEGGDDIDYDRRLLTSSDGSERSRSEDGSVHGMMSEFGDDNFVVGNWESKEVLSRDGHMRLSSQVFFASIDQRSERAAGASACTSLVAVIADWFQANRNLMPIQSQFDNLIREGSLEWRNLCENKTYRERFPDKHFDLETVLDAKTRPITVSPSKSFIGFFVPEGADGMGGLDFLNGAMSFDNIWEEISQAAEFSSSENPNLYIVSWNDHFFLLKVERDAYYIIDTLGERFYEGCSQAYILKFDDTTVIHKVSDEKKAQPSPDSSGPLKHSSGSSSSGQDSEDDVEEDILVSKGKESCKEYIKSFLAAIPIRELQGDIKRGMMASTPLHHRLQIEFHYTEAVPAEVATPPQALAIEAPFEFSWPEPPPAMELALAPAVAVA